MTMTDGWVDFVMFLDTSLFRVVCIFSLCNNKPSVGNMNTFVQQDVEKCRRVNSDDVIKVLGLYMPDGISC